MSTSAQVVNFNHQNIPVFFYNEKPYVAMKPVCENIGLDWASQYSRIKRDEVLNSTVVIITMVAQDNKNREVVALPIGYLNGWLLGIDTNRVRPEIRPTLIKYKLECYDVLYKHFMSEVAEQYPIVKRTTKDKRTALHEAIALLMTKSKHLHFKDCYKIIHQRFEVEHLDEIPEEDLPKAVAYVHGLLTGGTDSELERRAYNVSMHMLWVSGWWRCYRDAIQLLNPKMYAEITDHFKDGEFSASLVLGKDKSQSTFARINQDFPFLLDVKQRAGVLYRK